MREKDNVVDGNVDFFIVGVLNSYCRMKKMILKRSFVYILR